MISLKNNGFQNQNKAKFNNLDNSGVLSSDFPGPWNICGLNDLNNLNSLSGLNDLNSLISQNKLLSFMFPSTWHQKYLSWSLNVKWIIKNPLFYWFLAPFLLEAVEAIPWDQN